jgi:hypothetical protein
MPRNCGGCTQCCKVMGIKELQKAPNVWCQHCDIGVGCKIYSSRPESCQEFQCLWLQDEQMPEEWRPDKSKVVLSTNTSGEIVVAYIDPKQENSWQQGSIGRFLLRVAETTPVIIVIGNKRKYIGVRPNVSFDEEQFDGSVIRYGPNQGLVKISSIRSKDGNRISE